MFLQAAPLSSLGLATSMTNDNTANALQWLFDRSALLVTPSSTLSSIPLERELYDRARGVEFLFRLGGTLQLPSTASFTAATWFHRFYMRFSLEDYHRQDVAAACVFLASKTEECGRKLLDVARICQMKIHSMRSDPPESDVQMRRDAILLTEEALLEAICFDFIVESPHEILVDILEKHLPEEIDKPLCDVAWSLAHDSFRTVLCLLFEAKITAIACLILAQRYIDGRNSASLDVRIAATAPSASLPTPPSHKPASPDASRLIVEQCQLSEAELANVAKALTIMIEFYNAQDVENSSFLSVITSIQPPSIPGGWKPIYAPRSHVPSVVLKTDARLGSQSSQRTPESTHGRNTPARKATSRHNGWKPVVGEAT